MNAFHIFQRHDGTMRQVAQKLQVVRGKFLPGPHHGQTGDGIEIFHAADAGTGFVMIAAHKDSPQLA